MMIRATTLEEIQNVFEPTPLGEKDLNELDEFFVETMQCRMETAKFSPINSIVKACKKPAQRNSFLLMGHRGCGKSTELNKMSVGLEAEGYEVRKIQCGVDLDLNNCSLQNDLIILLGEKLLEIANDVECSIPNDILTQINEFWSEREELKSVVKESDLSIEAGIGVKSPKSLPVVNIFAKVKPELKYHGEKRENYRKIITNRISEWLKLLNAISDEITRKLNGKQPIIIFEDLDKVEPSKILEAFCNYSVTLTGVSIPLVYTFPIALSYDPCFTAFQGYFTSCTLPMIKQETINGEPYEAGTQTIIDIVEKRASLDLFDEGVLEYMVKKTGGSLRDLFHVINMTSEIALNGNEISKTSNPILLEDAKFALEMLKSELKKRISIEYADFLVEIYNGKRQEIADTEKKLKMLQAGVLLEYNGKCFYNLHPLIAEFLVDINRVEPKLDPKTVE